MNSAMMYAGDKLGLYVALHKLCCSGDNSDDLAASTRRTTTAVELADYTGLNRC